MPRHFVHIVLVILLGVTLQAVGQNITVINHYGDTTGLGENVVFDLAKSQQHTLIINYYEPASGDEVRRLEQLIGSALDFYIDESVEINDDRVKFRKGKNTVLKEMEQIVKDAVKFYRYKEVAEFSGFSRSVQSKIEEIERLDLSKGDWNDVDDPTRKEQFRYYYVQKHLNDLKLLANTEIGNFSNDNLMVMESRELEGLDEDQKARLLEEIEGFQTHDLLEPLKVDFPEASVTLLASDDEFVLPSYGDETTDDDFAERVFAMLEQNNSKLDRLQTEIDDLRKQQERDRLAAQERQNSNFQSQIDELRELIVELVKGGTVKPATITPTPAATIANLPDQISITFPTGGTSIGIAAQYSLNEIVDLMARHPGLKIMVTGYADKTGDTRANMLISQKRARSVRSYILKSGLSDDRIVMNYFGDKESSGANPEDRKVVIEFIP